MNMNMNTNHFLITAVLVGLLFGISGCSKETAGGADAGQHAEEGHEEDEAGQGSIKMDDAAMQASGIKVERIDAAASSEQLRAPGEVVDDAYGTTLITPRVDALVVRRHARLGDEVHAGAPLVTLSSVEVSAAQGELAIAEQEWRRVESLGPDAVSGRRYSEARIAYEQARAKARAYGSSDTARGSASGEFTLTAPHAGRITEDAFVVGERIEPGRTLFRLVDESVVWIDAKLPGDLTRGVPGGSKATVVTGGTRLSGVVLRQAHRTSEATRNATIRIEVKNSEDRLHAGDYVDVYLESLADRKPQISVPNDALIQLEGRPVVFRRESDGTLAPVEVRPGAVIGDRTVVEDGLVGGDTVVVEGVFALKAQLLKAQLGEGHAH